MLQHSLVPVVRTVAAAVAAAAAVAVAVSVEAAAFAVVGWCPPPPGNLFGERCSENVRICGIVTRDETNMKTHEIIYGRCDGNASYQTKQMLGDASDVAELHRDQMH